MKVRETTPAERIEAARNRRYMDALRAGHSEPVAAMMANEAGEEAPEAEIAQVMR
jgi:hypothetical protein